ncbi:hypothetical protein [Streptomyces zagrosensis]|uniref:Uncharacterized protein n=1 Tax=Streptomyces zagrosensis TaxID=1042984 RepID=A0A7W9QDK9_9ACTN|nr:hypothetical protein [Streptomyces zagrosensis]MBB5937042.1 hypothetical protein [Streptomyces zagrosensis]
MIDHTSQAANGRGVTSPAKAAQEPPAPHQWPVRTAQRSDDASPQAAGVHGGLRRSPDEVPLEPHIVRGED